VADIDPRQQARKNDEPSILEPVELTPTAAKARR
jgi:hypothetical protein